MNEELVDIHLVSGNITVFCGPHTQQFKSDVLNSSLYVELLAARASNDRDISWTTYSNTLTKLGWVINSRVPERSEFNKSSLLGLVTESIDSYLPAYDHQALVDAFSKLTALPADSLAVETLINKLKVNAAVTDDQKITSLTNTAVPTAMLLTIVRQDEAILTLQIAFTTTVGIAIDLLDQPVLKATKSTKNNIRLLRCSLDKTRYEQIRDTVITKLGSKIKTELLHVEVPSA
ncbi:hypothetical protein [Pseudomonas azerbaijanorientalis]|jgi:hypothetical protein|uniref:hypothetical protein n=1 Tax=Pseudomonas azerbaijanorientalis TaxID=2842350 RepID=UPI001C3C33F5|nr:hypothetical protein [Pseudomonas azerbaijanorientalis]QXH62549.1 hypothetical protein KSS91_03360 [Pseudomonas azerbaijanorientalis]